jgi:peptidoglycan/xylan/chitin deacetylase (PgdA/CDA1 family)
MNSNVLILNLHRVGYPPEDAKIRGLFVTPEILSFQIRLLKRLGYRFATLKDALLSHDERIAVITFDDGYADNFTVGLPVLDRHDVPATIFVITGDVGRKGVVWDEAGENLPADMVTWEMLAELQRKGWEIGSHGHRHVHFEEKEAQVQEALICHSVIIIEDKLGTVPISFAYPYGSYNESTKSMLRRFGIRFAVTTSRPIPGDHTGNQDLLELKRIPIGGRKFYHYFRNLVRTIKAIGFEESIRSLVPGGEIHIVPKETSK